MKKLDVLSFILYIFIHKFIMHILTLCLILEYYSENNFNDCPHRLCSL